MSKIHVPTAVAIVLTLAATVRAEPQRTDSVAPFINEQTFAVVRVDLTGIDTQALADWCAGVGIPEPNGLDEMRVIADAWLDQFTAAGGSHLYVVFSVPDLMAVGPRLVVPLAGITDPEAVAAMLGSGSVTESGIVAGLRRRGAAAPDLPVVPSPDLMAALAEAGQANAVAALALPAYQRKVIAETMPNLPAEAGGGRTEPFTHGMQWLALTLDGPPAMRIRLVVQCRDAAAAEALKQADADVKTALLDVPDVGRHFPNAREVEPMLRPRVEGDQLVLELDQAAIDQIADLILGPVMAEEELAARRGALSANVHNLLMGCFKFAEANGGEWPDVLEDIFADGFVQDRRLLRNPRLPDEDLGYVYLRPDDLDNPGVVVIHEAYDWWPGNGLTVGYLDGVVDLVWTEEELGRLLSEGR